MDLNTLDSACPNESLDNRPAPEPGQADPEVQVLALKQQVGELRRDLREEWIRFAEQHQARPASTGANRGWILAAGVFALLTVGLAVGALMRRDAAPPTVLLEEDSARLASSAIEAGRKLTAEGKHRDAVAAFSRAIAIAPHDHRGYMGRGHAYFQLEEYGPAAADFDSAAREAPERCEAYTWRGNTRQRQRNYEAAIDDFTTVIRLAPAIDVGYYNRGLAQYERHDYQAAIADLTEAVHLKPSDAANRTLRAKAYLAAGRIADAVEDLNVAIRLDSNNAPAYFLRATTHLDANRTELAMADIAEAIRSDPQRTADLARTYKRTASEPLASK